MVAPEVKLHKRVTADREGAGPPIPRAHVERAPEVEPRRFYVLQSDIEAHGQKMGCPGCISIMTTGRAKRSHNDECRERIRELVERTLDSLMGTMLFLIFGLAKKQVLSQDDLENNFLYDSEGQKKHGF